jgi:hypothetical protein
MVYTRNTAAQLRKTQANQQAVVYYSRDYTQDGTATFVAYNLPFATKHEIQSAEGQSSGIVTDTLPTTIWDVWSDALNNAALAVGGAPAVCPNPKLGDKLTDPQGYTWLVVKIDVKLFGDQHRLTVERMK